MGNNQSISHQMPLRCILDNWKLFDHLTLRSCSKFFHASAWSQYPLGNKEHWPENGKLNYNTILQLDLFCKRRGKWTEFPYVQIFFQLRDVKEFCLKYGLVVCPESEPTWQMATGIDNKEKKAPCGGFIFHGSQVAWFSFLVSKCPHIQEHSLHKSQVEYVP